MFKRHFLIHLLIIFLLLVISIQPLFASQNRIALVIGNDNYKQAALKNSVTNAKLISEKLQQHGFNVEYLTDASQRQMEDAIRRFGKKLNYKNNIGLFYFSGHSLQLNKLNYLLPIDAVIESEADVKYEAVDIGRVLSQMELAGNHSNLIILDSCRKNPFTQSFRNNIQGLTLLKPSQGINILYAAEPSKVVPNIENDILTKSLLTTLAEPSVDLQSILQKTANVVIQTSKGKQIPWLESIQPSQQLTEAELPSAKSDNEVFFWDNLDNTSIKSYQDYLLKFPQGQFIELANKKIKYLKKHNAKNSKQQPNSLNQIVDSATGMELIKIPSGCFQMGSDNDSSDEKPKHKTCITNNFYLGKYEVTQEQWHKIMGNNPSQYKKGKNNPVEQVSWNDIQKFIKKLNKETGKKYRLPTEAEWEYACRSGGKEQKYCGGNDISDYAWYGESWKDGHHSVGGKLPNGLGLYDMSGNVWEWLQDKYKKDYYQNSPINNPTGASDSTYRGMRGSSWGNEAKYARSVNRARGEPLRKGKDVGFRLAITQ